MPIKEQYKQAYRLQRLARSNQLALVRAFNQTQTLDRKAVKAAIETQGCKSAQFKGWLNFKRAFRFKVLRGEVLPCL